MSVKNKLSHLRNKQGVSAKRLAELVGVQRQTIYAMEAGTYVPNTLVALRLAQVLGVKVEDLFTLEEIAPAASATQGSGFVAARGSFAARPTSPTLPGLKARGWSSIGAGVFLSPRRGCGGG